MSVQSLIDAVTGEVKAVEAEVASLFHKGEAEVKVVEAVAKRTFDQLLAEFDALVADVRKLEAHLGFTPKA